MTVELMESVPWNLLVESTAKPTVELNKFCLGDTPYDFPFIGFKVVGPLEVTTLRGALVVVMLRVLGSTSVIMLLF